MNFTTSMIELTIPYFLKEIMLFIDDEEDKISRNKAIIYVGIILFISIFIRIARENYLFYQQRLAAKATQAMTGLIYSKIHRISSATNKDHSKGDIITFIQIDAGKLNMLFQTLPSVSRLPFQIII